MKAIEKILVSKLAIYNAQAPLNTEVYNSTNLEVLLFVYVLLKDICFNFIL